MEFLGNFLSKLEGLNQTNTFHYDKIVSIVLKLIIYIIVCVAINLNVLAKVSTQLKCYT